MSLATFSSLKAKLVGLVVITCVVALAVACVTFVLYDRSSYSESKRATLSVLARAIAGSASGATAFGDAESAAYVLRTLAAEPTARAGAVYSADDTRLASWTRDRSRADLPARAGAWRDGFVGGELHVRAPIESEGHAIGELRMIFSTDDVEARTRRFLLIATAVLALASFVSLLFAARVHRIVTGPIDALVKAAQTVQQKRDFSVRAEKMSSDELGLLTDAFNQMLDGIELRDRELEEHRAHLESLLAELKNSQEAMVRAEKLAAVGQLAASVGHELRNPLSAVRNAATYIAKRAADPAKLAADARVPQFLEIIDRELQVCARIISDLLDFARERPPALGPCPLRALATEAVGLVPPRANVRIRNDVPEDLPVPSLDREQFRQVLINLVQNAVESMPDDRSGEVVVSATGGGSAAWVIKIIDNGVGIPADVVAKIFQPLFTTKTKGTGLGLAIVANMITRHNGSIRVESELGAGSRFVIELPSTAAVASEGA